MPTKPQLLTVSSASKAFEEILASEIDIDSVDRNLSPSTSFRDHLWAIFGLRPAKHHNIWIDALEDENIRRLLIIVPPGHAKTTVAGVAYPSWRIGQNVSRHFMYMSSTATQAEKQSGAVRDLVVSEGFQKWYPDVMKSRTKPWAQDKWYLERPIVWDKDPTMLALGVEGPALGSRADEIIFDDVCDIENMSTAANRAKVANKVKAVAFSRQSGVSKNTRMVSIMTRWHAGDLADLFESRGFKVIWMPAFGYWDYVHPWLQEGNVLKLSDLHKLPFAKDLDNGNALWPEEYPNHYLEQFKEDTDIWQLEYQGMPVTAGGNLFDLDCFRLWSHEKLETEEKVKIMPDPYHVRAVLQFWDTASKLKSTNDYTVCETWVVMPDGYYLIHTLRTRIDFPTLVKKVKDHYLNPPPIPGPDGERVSVLPRVVYVEDSSNGVGTALIQTLRGEQEEARIPIVGIPPDAPKEERIEKASYQFREKPFYVPGHATAYTGLTLQEFLDEHLGFPKAKKDDLPDVSAYASSKLSQFRVDDDGEYQNLVLRSKDNGNKLDIEEDETTGKAFSRLAMTGGFSARKITRGKFGVANKLRM